jgi:hypothetical protein
LNPPEAMETYTPSVLSKKGTFSRSPIPVHRSVIYPSTHPRVSRSTDAPFHHGIPPPVTPVQAGWRLNCLRSKGTSFEPTRTLRMTTGLRAASFGYFSLLKNKSNPAAGPGTGKCKNRSNYSTIRYRLCPLQ